MSNTPQSPTIDQAQLLTFLAEEVASFAINKWLVQIIDRRGNFFSAYFAEPPKGPPAVMYGSKMEALEAALTQAMVAAIQLETSSNE